MGIVQTLPCSLYIIKHIMLIAAALCSIPSLGEVQWKSETERFVRCFEIQRYNRKQRPGMCMSNEESCLCVHGH